MYSICSEDHKQSFGSWLIFGFFGKPRTKKQKVAFAVMVALEAVNCYYSCKKIDETLAAKINSVCK